jgi:DNA-binding transcriptional regulator YiaG
MPNILVVLKSEISRLSRKEAKKYVEPIKKKLSDISRNAGLKKRQIGQLEKRVARLEKLLASARSAAPASSSGELDKVRVSPRLVKSQRKRLKINQEQLARLLKVSAAAVRSWEQGRTLPRRENLAAFVAIRKLGVKEARQRLGLPPIRRKKAAMKKKTRRSGKKK